VAEVLVVGPNQEERRVSRELLLRYSETVRFCLVDCGDDQDDQRLPLPPAVDVASFDRIMQLCIAYDEFQRSRPSVPTAADAAADAVVAEAPANPTIAQHGAAVRDILFEGLPDKVDLKLPSWVRMVLENRPYSD
jgi:hypothetical protein